MEKQKGLNGTAEEIFAPGLVSLFIPNFEAGGAERVMIRLAHGLLERGHRVEMLVLSDHGPYRGELDGRIRVVNLGVSRAWRAILPLSRYLRRHKPTVLLSAIFHVNFAAIVARWLSRSKTRIVISEHNTLDLVRSSVGYLRWLVFKLALTASYPYADSVICVSEGVATGLIAARHQLQGKVSVIGNPVVTDEVMHMSMEPVHHPWLAPDQPPLILAAGRLIPAKGFDVLIDAFIHVLAIQPAKLLILGNGPEKAALQSRIDHSGLSSHVSLYGFSSNPYAWMRRADVFVLSSRHEGLPGVLIEAMACGCKVVATDCPHGPREILEGGKLGRLVPTGDALALGSAIVDALAATHDTNTANRAHDFHIARVIQQYEKVLRL